MDTIRDKGTKPKRHTIRYKLGIRNYELKPRIFQSSATLTHRFVTLSLSNGSHLRVRLRSLISHISYLIFIFIFIFTSCTSTPDFSPKPKGYNRIDLPEAKYQLLTEKHPYQFEYNQIAKILPDTFRKAEPHWIFVYYPSFNAMIQFTYKPVLGSQKRLESFIGDAYKLAAKHQIKAYSIRDNLLTTKKGKKAMLLEIDGEVPSQLQFFTTDSTKHYLRGALYFKTAIANDSLAPIIKYIKKDCLHLLNSLEWK